FVAGVDEQVGDGLHEAGRAADVDVRVEIGRPAGRGEPGRVDPADLAGPALRTAPGEHVGHVEATVVADPAAQLVGVEGVLGGAHRVDQAERGPALGGGAGSDHRHQGY